MTTIRISLLISLFSILGLSAQETETPKPKTNTISQQFEDLFNDSNSWEDYKNIKKGDFLKLQKNTVDSISNLKDEINSLQNQITEQQSKISQLNDSLEQTNNTLDQTRSEKDSIYFLGIPMSKGGYMGMMWGIVAVLALALVFFIFRFKGSNAHTQEARKKLTDLEVEYDDYRKKALEKEQKMGRLLQDERNKAVKSTKK